MSNRMLVADIMVPRKEMARMDVEGLIDSLGYPAGYRAEVREDDGLFKAPRWTMRPVRFFIEAVYE